MASDLAGAGKLLARKMIAVQCVTATFLCGVLWLQWGWKSGLSAAVGALVSILPNLVFSHLAFKFAGASKSQLVVRSFSQGSKLKLLITIFLFVAAFQWPDLKVGFMFAGFIATMLIQWLSLIFIEKR